MKKSRLGEVIAYNPSLETEEILDGEIEVDESCFGGKRKGKRGRGAAGKVPVFGILKRGAKVYTKVIPDAKADTLAGYQRKSHPGQHCLF